MGRIGLPSSIPPPVLWGNHRPTVVTGGVFETVPVFPLYLGWLFVFNITITGILLVHIRVVLLCIYSVIWWFHRMYCTPQYMCVYRDSHREGQDFTLKVHQSGKLDIHR